MRFIQNRLTWIGLLSSGAALALTFRGLRWSSVGDSIASANYGLVALAVAVLVAALMVRAVRWRVLFWSQSGLRMWHLFGALNIGYALNNLLPLRVGELGRSYVISRKENVNAGRALSTILVERTLDTITVVVLLIVILPFIDAPGWARGPAPLLGAGFLIIAAMLGVASTARGRVMPLVRFLLRALPEHLRDQADRTIEAAIDGLAVIARPAAISSAACCSLVSWMLSAVVMYIVMRALAIDVPFTAGMFIMSATALGMVVPSSPGYIGVFHAIATESLVNVFGVDRNDAASFAVVQHAILYLTPIVLGGGYIMFEQGTWDAVRNLPSAQDVQIPLAD